MAQRGKNNRRAPSRLRSDPKAVVTVKVDLDANTATWSVQASALRDIRFGELKISGHPPTTYVEFDDVGGGAPVQIIVTYDIDMAVGLGWTTDTQQGLTIAA